MSSKIKRMFFSLLLILVVALFFTGKKSFANKVSLNLKDLSDRSFKNDKYNLSFKIDQSDHGTKNSLDVELKCFGKNGVEIKKVSFHEVCNIDYKSVKVHKTKKGFRAEYYPLVQVNWSRVYAAMAKGKDLKPTCDESSKEKVLIEVEGCR